MPKPTTHTSRAYSEPHFIPDGYVDARGALSIAGEALFGNEWTGLEIIARKLKGWEPEARQRWEEAVEWVCQTCYAGKITPEVITARGSLWPVPQVLWGAKDALKIFDKGTARFAAGHSYSSPSIEGHVLFPEQELKDALTTSTTTIAAEGRCQKWLADLMRSGNKEKSKPDYETEAKTKFGVGTRAFRRAWDGAIRETGKTGWGDPGRPPKSTP